jgi:SAM-dependent methyltransferase
VGVARIPFPDDLYDSLITAWREGAGARRGGEGRLTPDEMHAVAPRIRDLSKGFTRERPLAGERYLSEPGLLGAYLLHYWPISWCQASLCLAMLGSARGVAPVRAALDVGSGPGPVAMALLAWGAGSVTAVDRSAGALALARRLAAGQGLSLTTRTWDATSGGEVPEGSFDLVALGHTLNELWAGREDRTALRVSLLLRLARRLTPGGRFLLMEPALMQTAQDAIRVRDAMVTEGFTVELPCIWQGACPALPTSTCHGEFAWTPPPAMVRLAHMARIGRETLKTAWFVLRAPGSAAAPAIVDAAPADPPADPSTGLYRVVSEPLLSKSGRIRYLVCGPLGRFALSASKSSPGPGAKPFFTLRRGEAVAITGAHRRETGWGLEGDSTVRVTQGLPSVEG